MPDKLKLGIPKGSLETATLELFDQAGWRISTRARNYFPSINDDEITCALVRSQEMGSYVANSTLDLGLTGQDWILETGADVVTVTELVYSKTSDQPCRWVLVVKKRLTHSVRIRPAGKSRLHGVGPVHAAIPGGTRRGSRGSVLLGRH